MCRFKKEMKGNLKVRKGQQINNKNLEHMLDYKDKKYNK